MDASQISQSPPLVSPRKARHTILFLAANPLGTDQLALDREARAIQEELERSGYRDLFELVTRWAVEPMDLLRELRRLKPTLVHFCGHGKICEPREGSAARRGEHDGLFFHGPDGQPQFISTAALEESFASAGAAVRVVVLSACFSESQASVLAERVACVVGVGGAIRDASARAFAIGFYGGLGDSESVGAAFQQGLAAMRLQDLTHGIRPGDVPSVASPRLVTRPDVDPNELFLLHRPTRRARCSIVIKASLAEFDAIAIARLRDQLRTLSGDVSLEIIEVQEGSVRLTVSQSPEAAARLGEAHESGDLAACISFEVSSFEECGVEYVEGDAKVEPSRVKGGRQFADFAGAKLNGANFSKINLKGAYFSGAHLERAHLAGADLAGANLAGAHLAGAHLERANLAGANLAGANLAEANLAGANLERANLAGAHLFEANLAEAHLAEAHLAGANLAEAHLAGAHLAGANLAGANFRSVKYDEATLWPEGFGPASKVTSEVASPVAAGSRDGAEQVWQAGSGELQGQFNPRHNKLLSVELDRPSKRVLAASVDETEIGPERRDRKFIATPTVTSEVVPQQYEFGLARRRWFKYIASGVLAVSVAAAATFLIIWSLRDSTPSVGSVHIVSVPPGADVLFDGARLTDKTPLTIDGAPVGTRHSVRLELARHEPYEETVDIPKGGGETSVTAALKPILGKIIIDSNPPNAEIHINGQLRGHTPMTIKDIEMDNAKKLELRLKDYQPYVLDLVWPADGKIQINAELKH